MDKIKIMGFHQPPIYLLGLTPDGLGLWPDGSHPDSDFGLVDSDSLLDSQVRTHSNTANLMSKVGLLTPVPPLRK